MQKNEIQQFTTIWLSMAELNGVKLSENAVALACDALRDYPLDAIKKACQDHIRDTSAGRYMPKPAQIIERVKADRKKKQFYKRIESTGQIKSYVARNECVSHIKKLLPSFLTFEEREEERLSGQNGQ